CNDRATVCALVGADLGAVPGSSLAGKVRAHLARLFKILKGLGGVRHAVDAFLVNEPDAPAPVGAAEGASLLQDGERFLQVASDGAPHLGPRAIVEAPHRIVEIARLL